MLPFFLAYLLHQILWSCVHRPWDNKEKKSDSLEEASVRETDVNFILKFTCKLHFPSSISQLHPVLDSILPWRCWVHSSKRQMHDISRHVRKLFLWRNSTEYSEERNQLNVAAGMKFHYFRGQCFANIYFFPLDFPLYWHIFIGIMLTISFQCVCTWLHPTFLSLLCSSSSFLSSTWSLLFSSLSFTLLRCVHVCAHTLESLYLYVYKEF